MTDHKLTLDGKIPDSLVSAVSSMAARQYQQTSQSLLKN